MSLTDAPRAHGSVERALTALHERVDGEVRFDDGSRAAYSTDASNFRQVPIGVVVPRTIDAAVEAVAVCREHDLPIVNRGGGTSLAGQCTNEAVVLDFSKYCHRVRCTHRSRWPRRTCVTWSGSATTSGSRVASSTASPHCGAVPSPHPTRPVMV